jgi:uncharacterized membrane protein HdeD (DUF308 family)
MTMLDGILLILLGVFLVIPSETAHDMLIRGLGILLCAAAITVGARLWMSTKSRNFGPVAWLACIIPFVIGVILLIWPTRNDRTWHLLHGFPKLGCLPTAHPAWY